MIARVLRPAITFTTVVAVLAAALAVYAFMSAGATHADSAFTPVTQARMCNGLPPEFASTDASLAGTGMTCVETLTAGTATNYTTNVVFPVGNLNFSNVVTMTPNAPTAVAVSAKVGGLRSLTNLGLINAPCTTALPIDFILYNVALPNTAVRTTMTNIAWPTSEGTTNRHANWRVGDGQHQFYPAPPLPTDNDWAPSSAAGTSTGTSATTLTDSSATWIVNHWTGHTVSTNLGGPVKSAIVASNTATVLTLATAWDPAGTPASGLAYTVTGSNVTTTDGVTADGTTLSIVNYPHHLLDLFDPDFVVGVGDGAAEPKIPLAVYGSMTLVSGTWIPLYFMVFPATGVNSLSGGTPMPAPLGDINSSMGFPSVSVLTDPSAAIASPSSITDFCIGNTPLDITTMLRSTVHVNPAAGTAMFVQYNASQRDTDQDSFENQIDTCPYTGAVGVENPSNGIGVNDADGDGIMNSCDTNGPYAGSSCVVNAGPTCSDSDADDDGFSNRQDNCPQVANTTQVEGEAGVAPPDKGPRVDGIGDACDGAQGGPTGTGVITITQNGTSTTVGVGGTLSDSDANGRYMTRTNIVAKCFGGTDADGDGYCTVGGVNTDNADSGACAATTPNSCFVRHGAWAGATHPALQQDSDGDNLAPVPAGPQSFFTDAVETYMTTDPTKPCAQTRAPGNANNEAPLDNWPLDFDDNGFANVSDYLKYNTVLSVANGGNRGVNVGGNGDGTATTPATITAAALGGGPFSQTRYDLNLDGQVSTADLGKFNQYFNEQCGNVAHTGIPPATVNNSGTYQQ